MGLHPPILKDYIVGQDADFILRLNKTTKLQYKGKELAVNQISRKLPLFMNLSAVKIKKSKKYLLNYTCGAVKVKYKAGKQIVELWLVVTKRDNGGYCWLLTRSSKESITEVIQETFRAYGFRWKIEEYHRHIKSSYNLEDIQIKTFEGLQSMLAILTIAMSLIYCSLSSVHLKLILQSGIKTRNKEKYYELNNFIYYKISTIVKALLAHMTPRAFLPQCEIPRINGHMCLALEFNSLKREMVSYLL